ncbi:MAG: hypothetical protein AB7P07_02725 [Hyphomonadaceae bacterium]
MEKHGDHVEVTAEEASSGQKGFGVRYILMASVVLVVIGFILAAVFGLI